jgi:tRNA (guanine26-N2/guanine27-N2)-dimethyltransferase
MASEIYTEGMARVYKTGNAFLNPEARASRDISVAFVKALGRSRLTGLDATAATGIRGIRYSLEAGIEDVAFLEINEGAYADLLRNLKLNSMPIGNAFNTSIQEFANTTKGNFNLIDLDPFGGITPYVYDLMKVVGSGGTYFMATATDTAVLCGSESKACVRLYDAAPLHNELCHEAGMRILVGYIARTAAQFNLGIRVHLTLSYMHYMRAFIELSRGNGATMSSISSMGYAGYCKNCRAAYCEASNAPKTYLCTSCGGRLQLAGKLWAGSMRDNGTAGEVVKALEDARAERKTIKLAETIRDELDIPFYYSLPVLTRRLRIGSISMSKVIDNIEKSGSAASKTQFDKDGIKTDASIDEVIEAINKAR